MSESMMTEEDQSHLNILSICYFVLGGLGLAGTVIAALVCAAILVPVFSSSSGGGPPAEAMGFMVLIFGMAFLFTFISAAAMMYVGYCLRNYQHRVLCIVVACFACLNAPLGTLLGIFTIIVLCRPQVKAAFEQTYW